MTPVNGSPYVLDEDGIARLGAALIERAGNPKLGGQWPIEVLISDDVGTAVLSYHRILVPRAWLNRPPEVIQAAIAHELGHVAMFQRNWDGLRSVTLRVLGALASVWFIAGCIALAVSPMFTSSFAPLTTAGVLFGLMLAVGHTRGALGRRSEFAADRYAADLVGPRPVMRCLTMNTPSRTFRAEAALARALGLVAHPSTRARLRRLASLIEAGGEPT